MYIADGKYITIKNFVNVNVFYCVRIVFWGVRIGGSAPALLANDFQVAGSWVVDKTTAGRRLGNGLDIALLREFVEVFGKAIFSRVKLLDGVVEAGLIDGFDGGFACLVDRAEIIDRSCQRIAAAVIGEEILFGFFLFRACSQEQKRNTQRCRKQFHAGNIAKDAPRHRINL